MANDITKNLGELGQLVTVSGTNVTLGGQLTTTVPTPAVGDNSTNPASTAYVQNILSSGYYGSAFAFRNKLINGNFDIWQRGTSFTNPSNAYTADRWMAAATASNVTQTSAVTGYGRYAANITATASTNSCLLSQALEDFTAYPLQGQYVTFSFMYSASVAQPANSLTISVQKNATPNTMLSGTWTSLSAVAGASTFSPTTTPQKGYITVLVPSDLTAVGLRVNLQTTNITNGSSVYLYNVQLEQGQVPTSFEYRPISLEYPMCLRYCPAIVSSGTSSEIDMAYIWNSTTAILVVPFCVPARVAPTGIGISSATHISVHTNTIIAAASAAAFNASSQYAGTVALTVSGFTAGQGGRCYFNNASAYLYFTGCEL